MSDLIRRGRKATKKIVRNTNQEDVEIALLGRLTGSDPFNVRGKPGWVHVRLKLSNGAQVPPIARNDAGVPHILNLKVILTREYYLGGSFVYVVTGVSRRADLAYAHPPSPNGIPPHKHDDRYFRETEHITTSAGAADAGKPAKTDVNGKLDGSLLDVAEAIEDASAKTVLVNADLFGVADSAAAFVLKKFSWANALVQLDSEFAAINKGVNGGDAHDHGTTGGFGGGPIGTVGFLDDAVTNAKLAEMAANTVKANNTGSTANPTDVAAATLVSATIHAATLDTTPLDADEVPSLDSSASFGLLRTTWTSIKAFFKTYFDTLYVAQTGAQTVAGVKTLSDGIKLGAGTDILATYDEGTWTVEITGSTGNPTVTYTDQSGKFVVIGNVCFFTFRVVVNTISGGSGTLRISLPHTLPAGTLNSTNAAVRFGGVDLTGTDTAANVIFVPSNGSAFGTLTSNYDNGAQVNELVGVLAAGDLIAASGFYFMT